MMATQFRAVIKVGGSLAGRPPILRPLAETMARLARCIPILVVPGGGPFADAVRVASELHGLGDVTAHRMALLAMDQYGLLLTHHAQGSILVTTVGDARAVAAAGLLPVLLPSAVLWGADSLPNSWDVTSDSLAAWLAGTLGVPHLVLVKSVDGLGPALTAAEAASRGLVDPYFPRALPPGVEAWITSGSRPETLTALVNGTPANATRLERGTPFR